MNDEIKFDHFENINELLEHIDLWYEEEDIYYERWFGLNDLKKLKDYITNLQEEKYDYKSRNEKAIEYVESNVIQIKLNKAGTVTTVSEKFDKDEFLDILQGSDKE